MKVRLNITLEPEIAEELRQMAEDKATNVSQLVTTWVREKSEEQDRQWLRENIEISTIQDAITTYCEIHGKSLIEVRKQSEIRKIVTWYLEHRAEKNILPSWSTNRARTSSRARKSTTAGWGDILCNGKPGIRHQTGQRV